ncbi:ParA family protein [Methylobacterium sp. NEAU 140]|uniref:nucleotide-binding protein n=1 Tax=Methylobacterium sp. NEAU 140 TaxID=3064945 RepID=UPI0027365A60|nr:ParA family protein [Methylobacterium sp. NEAU 140]MDP4027015.1 ParA family protein [Methylobacterium sp. NEAU 140]
MKTLGVLSQKGGVGKTTLAVHLAVLADAVLIDTDPQRSAYGWKRMREAERPVVTYQPVEKLGEILDKVRSAGAKRVIVDTAGKADGGLAEVVRLSDLVVIPTRTGFFDLNAVGQTVKLVAATGRRAVFVLTLTPAPRPEGEMSVVREAREALAVFKLPIAPVALTQRAVLQHSLNSGHAVTEFDPGGKAAAELRDLWAFLQEELDRE